MLVNERRECRDMAGQLLRACGAAGRVTHRELRKFDTCWSRTVEVEISGGVRANVMLRLLGVKDTPTKTVKGGLGTSLTAAWWKVAVALYDLVGYNALGFELDWACSREGDPILLKDLTYGQRTEVFIRAMEESKVKAWSLIVMAWGGACEIFFHLATMRPKLLGEIYSEVHPVIEGALPPVKTLLNRIGHMRVMVLQTFPYWVHAAREILSAMSKVGICEELEEWYAFEEDEVALPEATESGRGALIELPRYAVCAVAKFLLGQGEGTLPAMGGPVDQERLVCWGDDKLKEVGSTGSSAELREDLFRNQPESEFARKIREMEEEDSREALNLGRGEATGDDADEGSRGPDGKVEKACRFVNEMYGIRCSFPREGRSRFCSIHQGAGKKAPRGCAYWILRRQGYCPLPKEHGSQFCPVHRPGSAPERSDGRRWTLGVSTDKLASRDEDFEGLVMVCLACRSKVASMDT
ncbi:hypothetical protein Pmar_PMAR012529 [Perkinsus marinus ATCC 50983]|uniref:Uncharacterized protein n=1 Tax=Perkinsus marinus (strain ATCC 50983 / TXsc) TaxID=423536 RepID=C5K7L3_PERM5|nr:hypothetical protein Pmar_PMAR012529 [Perkinsus marinus ATCC 50983]EER19548.1 hypothetical protein Pmar_PMAR012529 [Perkinsus marinus ATCC 50983]|eukprot:XP_002787752.1 hypothetical protein Pmar_PMAR012529 [Perkinsus marinus ATCC 50983]